MPAWPSVPAIAAPAARGPCLEKGRNLHKQGIVGVSSPRPQWSAACPTPPLGGPAASGWNSSQLLVAADHLKGVSGGMGLNWDAAAWSEHQLGMCRVWNPSLRLLLFLLLLLLPVQQAAGADDQGGRRAHALPPRLQGCQPTAAPQRRPTPGATGTQRAAGATVAWQVAATKGGGAVTNLGAEEEQSIR